MCPCAWIQTTVWRVGVNSSVADDGMSATQMSVPSNNHKPWESRLKTVQIRTIYSSGGMVLTSQAGCVRIIA